MIKPELLETLRCPVDASRLSTTASDRLACEEGHTYPVVEGVPVLLRSDVEQTLHVATRSLEAAETRRTDDPLFLNTLGIGESQKDLIRRLVAAGQHGVDPVVSTIIAATNGIAYRELVGRLRQYPIPELRLADGEGKRFLDVGCNWGRWCVSAARKRFRVVGIDPCLGAVLAAARVARAMSLQIDYVCGDARYLPFADRSFDTVFSYSVLQHFSRTDTARTVEEMSRVISHGGTCLVQMANKAGVRSLYHQARRLFRNGREFEVRYWGVTEIEKLFSRWFANVDSSAHCYFGLGLEPTDLHIVTPTARLLISASERLRRLNSSIPQLRNLADSVYVKAVGPLV